MTPTIRHLSACRCEGHKPATEKVDLGRRAESRSTHTRTPTVVRPVITERGTEGMSDGCEERGNARLTGPAHGVTTLANDRRNPFAGSRSAEKKRVAKEARQA